MASRRHRRRGGRGRLHAGVVRDIVDRVGGMDERFFMVGEEVDRCLA
jgi:hypothetical protein